MGTDSPKECIGGVQVQLYKDNTQPVLVTFVVIVGMDSCLAGLISAIMPTRSAPIMHKQLLQRDLYLSCIFGLGDGRSDVER